MKDFPQTRLVAVFGLFLCIAVPNVNAEGAEAKSFIEQGIPRAMKSAGAQWQTVDGRLVGSGKPNRLYATDGIGAGDFHLSAKLSIDRLQRTAAAFEIGDDNFFGFEGATGNFYLNGRIFGGRKQLMPSTDFLADGKAFTFEVERVGSRMRFLIDGKEVLEVNYAGDLGRMAFSPARSTMRIESLQVTGNLRQVRLPIGGKSNAVVESLPIPLIPHIDLNGETKRQVVVAQKSGQYYGQPDTELLADGKTMLVAYPLGHGGPDTEVRRSDDAGLTWSEPLSVPANFKGDHNAPALHRVSDATGKERILLIVSHPQMRQSISEDNGATWSPLTPMHPGFTGLGSRGLAPPKTLMPLRDKSGKVIPGNYLTMHHDRLGKGISLVQIVTEDGGRTWSKPRPVGDSPGHPCEPVIIRSPDGKQLLVLARENSRTINSLWMTSDDEGKTWSELKQLPATLNGDRHEAAYTDDGRLFVTFRCRSPKGQQRPFEGDWVGWVGTYDDIINGRPGQYVVRLKDNLYRYDCAYPGLEVLPDQTFVTTTYGHWTAGEQPYLISVRFQIDELDRLAENQRPYSIPIIDLDQQTQRQVVVDREQGQYLGHPTTCLLEDGETMLSVYPKGHGRGGIVYKRSVDGGLTWSERLPTPESWATSKEVPTLHRVTGPDGKKRIIMFSGLNPCRMAVTEDDGETWSEIEPIGQWGGIVTMGSVEALRTGKGHYMALFHDDGRFFADPPERQNPMQMTLYKTLSADGGLTWSFPEVIDKSVEYHICEPGLIRSPDGKQLAVLLRENSRRHNSQIIFSNDEGNTWTKPRDLPATLNGDRHTGKYGPDGRLLISFRCRSPKGTVWPPTEGDWVAWVGTYEDLVSGDEGQYVVRLKNNHESVRGSGNIWDCAYPGVEVLPDGTFVVTTYGHWQPGESPYVLSVRLQLDELDENSSRTGNESNSELDQARNQVEKKPVLSSADRARLRVEEASGPPRGLESLNPITSDPLRDDEQLQNMPNVLFIAVDDWNDWVGCLGHGQAITPNVDRLAARGILFADAHCAAPVCNPSRVAIMTGKRPGTTGVYNNGQSLRKKVPNAVTMSTYFSDHGYYAIGGGKVYHDTPTMFDRASWNAYYHWHPDPYRQRTRYYDVPSPYSNPPDPEPAVRPSQQITPLTKRNFDWAALDQPESDWPDYKVASWAADFLSQEHDRPFFLAVGIFRPHVPWFNPKAYVEQYPLDSLILPQVKSNDLDDLGPMGRRLALDRGSRHDKVVEFGEWKPAVQAYLASISFADANVGRVINALDSSAYRDNTIVVFWSDHGYHLGEKNHWHKFTLWNRSTHVPLVVVAPGVTRSGSVCREPVNLLDIYPTLTELCGLDPRSDLDGESLVPLLRNPDAGRSTPSITTHGAGNHSARTKDWTYIRYSTGEEELYDRKADPNEWRNLAGDLKYSAIKKRLAATFPRTVDVSRRRLKIVAFGDSTTAKRDTVEQVYADRLPNLLQPRGVVAEVINSGVGGSHTGRLADNAKHDRRHALDRFRNAVLVHEPDVAIIQFGWNDSWVDSNNSTDPSRIPLKDYTGNLRKMVTRLQENDVDVVLMTPNRPRSELAEWRTKRTSAYVRQVRLLARELDVSLVDVWSEYSKYEKVNDRSFDDLLLDNLHPNDQGHELVAELLADCIQTLHRNRDDLILKSHISVQSTRLNGQ